MRSAKRDDCLADLTVSKRPGTGHKIEIHFSVVSHYIFCFPLSNLLRLSNCL